jgi:hypothetical protein
MRIRVTGSAGLAWLVSDADENAPEPGPGRRLPAAISRGSAATPRCWPSWIAGSAAPTPAGLSSTTCDAEVTGLLRGQYADGVGRELFAAVAEASLLAALASYDCGLHGLGQRYVVHALRLAQSGSDCPARGHRIKSGPAGPSQATGYHG